MTDDAERLETISNLIKDFDRLVAFADKEDAPVLGAKLEDARSAFNMRFVWSTD